MSQITAQAVNEFRKKSGLGLMEAKNLLSEAGGDGDKALTLAKERNLVKAGNRSGRATNAGRVEVALAPDGRSGAIVEINCETDFVARNDEFRALAKGLAEHVLATGQPATIEALKSSPYLKDTGKTIGDLLVEVNARTGENVVVARAEKIDLGGPGRVDAYVHHDAKSGALVGVAGADSSDDLTALVKDLALQVVAAKPLTVRPDELPAAAVEEQKRIFITQASDKPEAVREKIATGKLAAWYREVALLDQAYVKDAALSVKDVVAKAGKDLNVVRFARYVVGESPETA